MKRFGILVLCYEFGWSLAGIQPAAPDVPGKDDEKHQVHSAFNPTFVAESRVVDG